MPINNLLSAAWTDLHDVSVLWQIAILLACFSFAWAAVRALRVAKTDSSGIWKFGVGGLRRILFPLVALVLLTIAIGAGKKLIEVDLLRLFVPVLGSLLLVRIFFYLLRHAFAQDSIVRTFERTIAIVVWGGFLLHVFGLLPELVEFLDDAAFHVGRQRLSVWLLLQGAFWMAVTLLAALWLGGTIEAKLMRADALHSSLRVAFSRLAKSLLLLLAVLIAFPLVGIDLTVLSVFGGALGVGLGFGLQKIASNYMSGFIILIERSIRIGDMITADNFYGEVKSITTRYVVVRGLDGREAIIPNELLITSTVLSHSYTDRVIRLAIGVQIGYGSDLDKAMQLMVEAARRNDRVLAEPAPAAFLSRFGDSGIDLELGVWIGDPEKGMLNVRSDLNIAIWRAFRDAGIAIPYPQREVRILPGPASAV